MESKNLKIIIPLLSLICLISGVIGLLDLKKQTTFGYQIGDGLKINKIQENTSAEAAGLKVEDKIISIDGIPFEDARGQRAAELPKAGDTQTYVVSRDGKEQTIEFTFLPLSSEGKRHQYFSFALGIVFLLGALWLLYKHDRNQVVLASLFLLLFGAGNFPDPHFTDSTSHSIKEIIGLGMMTFSLAFLIDFLLHYPEKKEFRKRSFAKWLLYLPALLLPIMLTWVNFALTTFSDGILIVFRYIWAAIFLFYIGWIIFLLIQNFRRYSSSERSATGLNVVYTGLLIAFVPILISILLFTFFPTYSLPFSNDFFALFLMALPISLLLAIEKWGKYIVATASGQY